jgi:hypothetical protein
MFDGAAGHYQAVTGQVLGDMRYTNTTGATVTLGVLTLMTLDVKSNRPNNPVLVDLDFFGSNRATSAMKTSCRRLRSSSAGKRHR